MTLRFGTDGVRGLANVELTPELALALGRAAARVLGTDRPFVVGRDTRLSGPMLYAALVAGLTGEGAAVLDAGVLPTPGVAYLSQVADGPAAMISASHNHWADNGIKFFDRGGRKLADDVEELLEAELDTVLAEGRGSVRSEVGTVRPCPDGLSSYVDHLVGTLEGRRLDGLLVVVDAGHGAASVTAGPVLERLGARVVVRNAAPDGRNINAGCGSTHPQGLQAEVTERGAAAGLAFDGDADRLIAVDEAGRLVDGDHILALAALDLRERGRLPGGGLVTTVMANLGLRQAMEHNGIEVVETPVGDRSVLAAMEERGLVLGGEQSGHLIFSELATTGDGLLAGLVVLDVMVRRGKLLSELAGVVTKFPQVLRNVAVADRDDLGGAAAFWDEVRAVEAELGAGGRVLVRPSGTEPLVRIMVEAATIEAAERQAGRLADALGAQSAP